jgi:phosphomannomutase
VTTLDEPDLEALALAWLAVDPDADNRAEIERLSEAGGREFAERFGTRLEFGTAGLRGRLGAGPTRMNRVIVRVVAAALAAQVRDEADPHVVVGYDARHGSTDFARDTARVLAARGVRCTLFPEPGPTPLLAFAVRHLDASAGVMVTASHNPRDDNGYKVYGRGGALITAPVDTEIADRVGSIALLSEDDLAPLDHPGVTIADDSLIDAYVDTITTVLDPAGSRSARVAYTPIHGVGAATVVRAFAAAGFSPPALVEVQAAPDPDFPTAAFPNPEESGVLDHLLALATEIDADVALANDPDADRLAVAVRNGPAWHLLSGDDLGCILAEHLLSSRSDDPRSPLVINTVVSSRLLAKIADHHGVDYAETLTGFKWIMHERARRDDARLVLGYEEALGYAVCDDVRDKDGISAALVVTELAGRLRDEGRTLLDALDDLHRRHGVHRGGQRSLRFEESTDGEPVMDAAMTSLRTDPPTELAGAAVRSVDDLLAGETGLPPTNGVVLNLDNERVVVRPSGTEPKMKVYVEACLAPTDDLAIAREEGDARMRAVADVTVARAAEPERPAAPDVDAEDPVRQRAERLFSAVARGAQRAADLRLAVSCVDLTTLEGDDTPGRIRALCAQARRPAVADPTVGPTAAVCVYPELVPLVAELLAATPVRTASVAGAFPSGLSGAAVRAADIADAVERGAEEVDIVLNRSAFLSGRADVAARELAEARTAAGHARLKVIIEVGELVSLASIRAAGRLAIAAGADFVNTSTGKASVGASPAAVLALLEEISEHHTRTGRRIGIKLAAGVTADDALGCVALVRDVLGDEWLSPQLMRFDAPSVLVVLLTELTRTEAALREH